MGKKLLLLDYNLPRPSAKHGLYLAAKRVKYDSVNGFTFKFNSNDVSYRDLNRYVITNNKLNSQS